MVLGISRGSTWISKSWIDHNARRFGSRFLKQRTQNRMHWGWSIQPDSARGETDPGEEEKLQQKHPQKHGQNWQNQSKKQGKTRKTPLICFLKTRIEEAPILPYSSYHGSQKMLEFGRVEGLEFSWFGTHFLLTRGLKRYTSTLSLASTILWGPFHQPFPVSGFWVQDIHSQTMGFWSCYSTKFLHGHGPRFHGCRHFRKFFVRKSDHPSCSERLVTSSCRWIGSLVRREICKVGPTFQKSIQKCITQQKQVESLCSILERAPILGYITFRKQKTAKDKKVWRNPTSLEATAMADQLAALPGSSANIREPWGNRWWKKPF